MKNVLLGKDAMEKSRVRKGRKVSNTRRAKTYLYMRFCLVLFLCFICLDLKTQKRLSLFSLGSLYLLGMVNGCCGHV